MIPVETKDKWVYLELARKTAPSFAEHAATRTVECWGDDVMDGGSPISRRCPRGMTRRSCFLGFFGRTNDLRRGGKKDQADDHSKPEGPLPFDGRRMTTPGSRRTPTPAAAAISAMSPAWSQIFPR